MRTQLIFAIALLFIAMKAQSATLDFLPAASVNSGSVVVPGATLTHASGGDIVIGPLAGVPANAFCFIGAGGCDGDGELIFNAAVTGLNFGIFEADVGDSADISFFNGAALLGTFTLSNDGIYDASGFGAVTRIVFVDNDSTVSGMAFGNISFDGEIPAIPLPAGLPLMLSSVFALSFVRRRKTG